MKSVRRWCIGMLILAIALSGCAGKKAKVYRVGVLSGLEVFATTADSFKAGMAALGYQEGKNIVTIFTRYMTTMRRCGRL